MGVIAKDNGTVHVLHPAGVVQAVCIDVEDLGEVETSFEGKSKTQNLVNLHWETEEMHPEFNEPFRVRKRYNNSLNEKATLCKDLESWRGRPFSDEDKKGFDLDKLLGKNCMLNIVHEDGKDGKTYANIKAITPISKKLPPIKASDGYVRLQDREGYVPPKGSWMWEEQHASDQVQEEADSGDDFDF